MTAWLGTLPRAVLWFWAVFISGLLLGIGWLAYLGPPAATPVSRSMSARVVAINAPSAALSRPSMFHPAWSVPRPSPYGVLPMHYYAAQAPKLRAGQARIALLVTGFGALGGPGRTAIGALPAGVSLSISPFGMDLRAIARSARRHGIETLVSLPVGGGAARPEPHILSIANQSAVNGAALDWALSRFGGYVGVTDAGAASATGRFLQDPADAFWLVNSLKADGLFLLDINPAAALPDGSAAARATMVIGAHQGVAGLDAGLARLVRIAERRGSAIGVVESPNIAERSAIAAWAAHLPADAVLVPVSAVMAPDHHS